VPGNSVGGGGGAVIPGVSISPPKAAVDNKSERLKAVMRGAIFLIFFFLGEANQRPDSRGCVEPGHNNMISKYTYYRFLCFNPRKSLLI
jgi:hypothetical protein